MKRNDSPGFMDPANFAREARAALALDGLLQTSDPHLSLDWFALLAEAAMPAGARLALFDVSSVSVGAKSFLPLMYLPDQQQRVFGLSNFYTPLFGMVNEGDADSRRLETLARQLKADPKGFAEIRFSPMDTESASYAMLKTAFRAAGWVVDDYFCFGNWYQPTQDMDADAYISSRPAMLRNTLQRAEKRLTRTIGFQLQIHQEPGDNLESAIADFVEVYRSSWKSPEPYPEFIPGLCRLSAKRGWLRLGILRLESRPLAAQIWIVSDGKAQIVKLAYDKSFTKTSAGTVLSAALFRHVISVDRVSEIDYLIGDDAYKADWMSLRRERRGIVAFNPGTSKGFSSMLSHGAGKLFKRMRRV